jgi:hypothetical protein
VKEMKRHGFAHTKHETLHFFAIEDILNCSVRFDPTRDERETCGHIKGACGQSKDRKLTSFPKACMRVKSKKMS